MNQDALVGHVITQMFLSTDREAIKFVLDGGKEIVAQCEGDCCSHTWIEDVINPEAAIGSPVLTVESLELPKELQKSTLTDNYEEEMQYYGLGIDTAKGRFTIAYRNSSNGYYGGWMNWGTQAAYGTPEWKLLEGN